MIFIRKRTMERNVLYFITQFYNKRSNPGDKRSNPGDERSSPVDKRSGPWIARRVLRGSWK
jgi:hypothetical protein